MNEKIEGFFDVCKSRKLTGKQGVIIPHQNVQDLLLRPDVVEAIKNRKFHIYPIKTIGEGITILTGVTSGRRLSRGGFTPGSVMAMADDKLLEMAIAIERFGRDKKSSDNSRKK